VHVNFIIIKDLVFSLPNFQHFISFLPKFFYVYPQSMGISKKGKKNRPKRLKIGFPFRSVGNEI